MGCVSSSPIRSPAWTLRWQEQNASQTITITSDPGSNVHHQLTPPYTVTATSTSGLAVVFTTDPSSAGVCSVSGSTVTYQGKGQCIIYANQAGNANWLPAPTAQQSFRVK